MSRATQSIFGAFTIAAYEIATFQEMGDGTWVGRVPELKGVIAFGATDRECRYELISVVEDWARFSVKRGQHVPILGEIYLNTDLARSLLNH